MVRFIKSPNTSLLYSLQEALCCCRTLIFYLASFETLLLIMVVLLLYCWRILRSHLASCSITLLRLLLGLVLFASVNCTSIATISRRMVKEKLFFPGGLLS